MANMGVELRRRSWSFLAVNTRVGFLCPLSCSSLSYRMYTDKGKKKNV